MKVYIGPSPRWVGPRQIAEKIMFWYKKPEDPFSDKSDMVYTLASFLAKTPLNTFCVWLYNKQKRKVKIRVDNYDVWNADNTLALLILPVLKKFREESHSTAHVSDEDVPEELRSVEDFSEEKWRYVLDEMIWAFEQLNKDWMEQYYVTVDGSVCNDVESSEAIFKHEERMNNGFILFGKYFRSLWTQRGTYFCLFVYEFCSFNNLLDCVY